MIHAPAKCHLDHLIFAGVVLCIALLWSTGADAASSVQNLGLCNPSGVLADSITPKAMYCVRNAIAYAIDVYYGRLLTFLNPAIYLAAVLAVTLFGIRLMAAQIEDMTRDSMTLMFRIAIVFFLLSSWGWLYPAAFQTIDDLTGIVFRVVGNSGYVEGFDTCVPPAFTPPAAAGGNAAAQIVSNPNAYKLWFQFDCMIGRLFGAGNVAKYSLATSMVAVLGAALFSNIFGLALFMAGMTAILAVFFVIVRSVFVVLLALLSLGFAAIVAPIFIPTLLFKYTTPYFLKWINLIVQSIVQPVFVMAFLMFALSLFLELLFGAGLPGTARSLSANMGINPQTSVEQAFDSMACGLGMASLSTNHMPADKEFESIMGDNRTPNDAKKTSNATSAFFQASGIDLTAFLKMFSAVGELWNRLKDFLITMLALLFLSYVTLNLLYTIPDIASAIAGTVAMSLIRIAGMPMGIDTKIAAGMNALQESAQMKMTGGAGGGMLSKLSGGAFQVGGLAGGGGGLLPKTIGGGISGFARGTIGGAKAGFSGSGGVLKRTASGVMRGALGGLKGGFSGAGQGMVGGAKNVGSLIVDTAASAPRAVKDVGKSIATDITKGTS